jgi:hypothetical protein
MSSTRRTLTPGQIRLDQRLFHRGLAPAIALDDGRLERKVAQLRHLQGHLSDLGVQLPLIAARTSVLAAFGSLVLPHSAQVVRFRI